MSNERTIEYVDLYELEGDERNPKDHDVGTIDASMNRFGVIDPIVVDGRTQKIVSGHGRHKTLVQMFEQNLPAPDGVQVDDDTGQWRIPVYTGWASDNDTESAAALIALNRTTELGGWVDEELLELLAELSQQEDGLEGVGFYSDDLTSLQDLQDSLEQDVLDALGTSKSDESEGSEAELEESGHNYKNLDVLVGDPKNTVRLGEVYVLDGRHILAVTEVSRDHHNWSPFLEGRVFAPYPDIYLILGSRPKEEDFLLVQPSTYLAGHILDVWESVHGKDSIELRKGNNDN